MSPPYDYLGLGLPGTVPAWPYVSMHSFCISSRGYAPCKCLPSRMGSQGQQLEFLPGNYTHHPNSHLIGKNKSYATSNLQGAEHFPHTMHQSRRNGVSVTRPNGYFPSLFLCILRQYRLPGRKKVCCYNRNAQFILGPKCRSLWVLFVE